jgi:restriction system protein
VDGHQHPGVRRVEAGYNLSYSTGALVVMSDRYREDPWNPEEAVEVTPTEYEQQIVDWIKASGGTVTDFRVGHLVKLSGSAGEYEFDAVAEVEMFGGARVVFAFECKRYRNPVKRDVVAAFHAKLQDAAVHKGFILCTAGFQRGALEYADRYGIAAIVFVDGRATYETKSNQPAPHPPPWFKLPRFAGYLVRANDRRIECELIDEEVISAFKRLLLEPLTKVQ